MQEEQGMQLPRDPVPDRPEWSCAYCGESTEQSVVKCTVCNRWFCNGMPPRSHRMGRSHIVTHMALSGHHSIVLHEQSPLGDTPIECYKCGNNNVFALGLVAAKQENVLVQLCRVPCSLDKSQDWDTDNWQPIIEERQLLPWLAVPPTRDAMLANEQLDPGVIKSLEALWRKSNKEATTSDIEEAAPEEEVEPILIRYYDAAQYQRSYAPLVHIESETAREQNDSKTLQHISIEWDQHDGRSFASFSPSTYETSMFRIAVGDKVVLKCDSTELKDPWHAEGYIVRLPGRSTSQFAVEFRGRPPQVNGGDLCSPFTVEFKWNDIPYKRMQKALISLATSKKALSPAITAQILGQTNPLTDEYLKGNAKKGVQQLNGPQHEAVQYALSHHLTLIQGPPGTGKTVTSAAIVVNMWAIHRQKILVCAPSNVAVDHLALKLIEKGLKVVRLVAKSREDVDSSVSAYTLNNLIVARLSPEVRALHVKIEDGGSLHGKDMKTYKNAATAVMHSVLKSADVVCCTCTAASDKRLAKLKFRSVLIDESTQSCEPETLIPIVHGAQQVVLVGDHKQLGPTIINRQASDAGLQLSLFERLIMLGHTPQRLQVQYRMHPALSEFSSNMFYEGSLQNGVTMAQRSLPGSSFPWPIRDKPMMFWASYSQEEISPSGTSYLNRVEAMNIERIVSRLFLDGVQPNQIGIITPYQGQRAYVEQYMELTSSMSDRAKFQEVEVESIDAFQGREKDYIIMSCVRANEKKVIGFLKDPRRLNVALTRAKYGCIILGNPVALSRDRLWNQLLSYYRDNGCLVEGQLDNLQICTVQLSQPRSQPPDHEQQPKVEAAGFGYGFPRSRRQSFDTASIVSYDGIDGVTTGLDQFRF